MTHDSLGSIEVELNAFFFPPNLDREGYNPGQCFFFFCFFSFYLCPVGKICLHFLSHGQNKKGSKSLRFVTRTSVPIGRFSLVLLSSAKNVRFSFHVDFDNCKQDKQKVNLPKGGRGRNKNLIRVIIPLHYI